MRTVPDSLKCNTVEVIEYEFRPDDPPAYDPHFQIDIPHSSESFEFEFLIQNPKALHRVSVPLLAVYSCQQQVLEEHQSHRITLGDFTERNQLESLSESANFH